MHRVSRVSFRSSLKLGLVVGFLLALSFVIAVSLIYFVMDLVGAFDKIFPMIEDLFKVNVSFTYILPATLILAAAIWITTIPLSIFSALVYNFAASITGGLEIDSEESTPVLTARSGLVGVFSSGRGDLSVRVKDIARGKRQNNMEIEKSDDIGSE